MGVADRIDTDAEWAKLAVAQTWKKVRYGTKMVKWWVGYHLYCLCSVLKCAEGGIMIYM